MTENDFFRVDDKDVLRPEILSDLMSDLGKLRAELTEAKRLLKETNDALSHAFLFEDVPQAQFEYEIENGRWDGVRGIVEVNEEFLDQ